MRLLPLATVAAVLAAPGAALAFDCTKAKTDIEKAICADPAAKAADDAMSAAYAAAKALLDAEQQKALRDDQRDWVKRRNDICMTYPDQGQATPDAECLARMATDRAGLLSAAPVFAGPDAPRFAPVILRDVDEAAQLEVSIIRPQVVEPQTPAMNQLNGLLAKAAGASETDIGSEEGPYGRIVGYRIGYASGRFVSVDFDIYEYTGGAHGMSYNVVVNFLPEAGRALKLDDVIDAKGKAALIPLCRASVTAEKHKREVPEELIADSLGDEALADGIGDIANWGFDGDGVRIHYAPYALGSYAEGGYDCTLSWAALKPLTKADAPLPFDR
ncbi:lysozyme inhibitor LprI family protein [Zavarzinia sp.]|uniref:lysozyme inhibitor LprI family protein n=1 Tax=Zavarzinia sp. TaxID=2027920 RepID=UPI00356B3E77